MNGTFRLLLQIIGLIALVGGGFMGYGKLQADVIHNRELVDYRFQVIIEKLDKLEKKVDRLNGN